jgi:hypothetical protein
MTNSLREKIEKLIENGYNYRDWSFGLRILLETYELRKKSMVWTLHKYHVVCRHIPESPRESVYTNMGQEIEGLS